MRNVFAVLTVFAGGVRLSRLASSLPAPTLWWGLHASPMRVNELPSSPPRDLDNK